jgi:glutamate carboxypeptidase
MTDLTVYFKEQQVGMIDMLQELAAIESPSHDPAAVNRMADRTMALMSAAGATVQRIPGEQTGDMLLATWGNAKVAPAITFLAHMDTVYPMGTLVERPIRMVDGRLFGPGVFDLKAGIVIALHAVSGLQARRELPNFPIQLLCTADEEVGSHASRSMIEQVARQSRLVLVMEPALPGGVVKTWRKGVGGYTIRIRGRAAHAGGDHQKGRNAIEEMAHQILALQRLTDYELGTTVNVGVIRGGTTSNVVPETCEIEVDFRIMQMAEGERIQHIVHNLQPVLKDVTIEVDGGLNRPPMERDERMLETFAKARQIAGMVGFDLQESGTGGASDGNFTARLAPTLDGMGADGDGAHALHEHVLVDSLPQRAALVAALLRAW